MKIFSCGRLALSYDSHALPMLFDNDEYQRVKKVGFEKNGNLPKTTWNPDVSSFPVVYISGKHLYASTH